MSRFIWDLRAALYTRFRKLFPFGLILKKENRVLRELIAQIPYKEAMVVDVGTGTGNGLENIDAHFHKIGIDLNYRMLLLNKHHLNVPLIQCDAGRLALKDKIAEIVLSCGLLEYFKYKKPILEEIYRITKKQGYAVITYSPANLFLFFRRVLGNKIYGSTFEEMKTLILNNGYRIVDNRRSLMQHQLLIHKIK